MNALLLAEIVLIVLHNVDGREITINVEHIVALQDTNESLKDGSNTLLAGGVKCAIGLESGKRVSVKEDCTTVRQAIRQAEKLM